MITTIEKGSSKGSIDSLAVEIAEKLFFKEEKNIDMNAIKHATQPTKDSNNILSSQKHLLSRKISRI